MKVKNRFIRTILLLALAAIIAIPAAATVQRSNPIFKDLGEKKGVSTTMAFTIPFSKPLMAGTIKRANIYMTDSAGRLVGIDRTLSPNKKNLIVRPVKPYAPGAAYTLYIKGEIKYADGKYIENGLKQKFTVAQVKDTLPVLGSEQNLRKLLEQSGAAGALYPAKGGPILYMGAQSPIADQKTKAETSKNTVSSEYSTTNVQVQGVDEADIIKTDGKYIYTVNNGRVIIANAYPANSMKLVSTLSFKDGKLNPQELYVDEKYLVVIGTSNNNIPSVKYKSNVKCPPYYHDGTVKAVVFDITDKANVKQVREIELEGQYISSRKIGSRLYLVANRNVGYYAYDSAAAQNYTPSYRDSAVKNEFVSIDYKDIRYFPDSVEAGYLVVAGIDLENPSKGTSISAFLGSGENIYATEQDLYVALSRYEYPKQETEPAPQTGAQTQKPAVMPPIYNYGTLNTTIYRFVLNDGKADYTGRGKAPGRILNQFSMDESTDSFRIATTNDMGWGENNQSSSSIYTMDFNMNNLGKIEKIAPGEKMYSVRFMGNRAYMVTFKTVDPLFVIDLKDAKNPKILGALKIPGYSEYLHPYDENHIIGFGKDTVEVSNYDESGKPTGSSAFYQGMKLALFDVTDVNHPVEMFKEMIGDRGTNSPLLYDHKALLFSKEKNLLAFPVELYEIKDKDKSGAFNEAVQYGSFTFQGAYVYNIDLVKGFKLRGKIGHMTDEDYLKAGNYGYDYDKNVQRIIYIGDNFYTVSNGMIKANGMSDLKETGHLDIPQP